MWDPRDPPEDPMLERNRMRRESEKFAQAMLGFPLVGDQDLRHHLQGHITMQGARKAYWELHSVYLWIQALILSPHNVHLLEPKVTVLREMAGDHLDWLFFWAGYEQFPEKMDRLVFPVNVEAFAWLRVVLYELRNGVVSAKGLMNIDAPALVCQPLAAPMLELCPLLAPAPVASSGMCPGSSSDGTAALDFDTSAPLSRLKPGMVAAEIHDARVQQPSQWDNLYPAFRHDGHGVGSDDPRNDKPRPCPHHDPDDLKQNCKHCYAIFQWMEDKRQGAASEPGSASRDEHWDCTSPDDPLHPHRVPHPGVDGCVRPGNMVASAAPPDALHVPLPRIWPPQVAVRGGCEPDMDSRSSLAERPWLVDDHTLSGTSHGSQQSSDRALAGHETTQDHEPGSASRRSDEPPSPPPPPLSR